MICGYLFFFDRGIGFRLRHLFMKTGDLVGEYIRISIPVLVSDGILAIGNNTVAMVVGHLSMAFVAANAVTSVTQQMSNVLAQGVAQAGAIVTGQTLGEGERDKALSQGYTFLGMGLGLGLFAALVIRLISGPVIPGDHGGGPATHGRHRFYHDFPVHQQHHDQRGAARRRRHQDADAGG